jgi:hypothetical protein
MPTVAMDYLTVAKFNLPIRLPILTNSNHLYRMTIRAVNIIAWLQVAMQYPPLWCKNRSVVRNQFSVLSGDIDDQTWALANGHVCEVLANVGEVLVGPIEFR